MTTDWRLYHILLEGMLKTSFLTKKTFLCTSISYTIFLKISFEFLLYASVHCLFFYSLVSLSEINISANDIEHLPPSIGLLRHLRTLYLDENFLMGIPPEVCQYCVLSNSIINLFLPHQFCRPFMFFTFFVSFLVFSKDIMLMPVHMQFILFCCLLTVFVVNPIIANGLNYK